MAGLPKVVPFMSHDGPRLAIETTDGAGRHRLLLPPSLRLQLIAMLRRAQGTETKISERPLSIARTYDAPLSGPLRRNIVVQYHERQPGEGVKVQRVAIPVDQVQEFISRLWDIDAVAGSAHGDEPLDTWLA